MQVNPPETSRATGQMSCEICAEAPASTVLYERSTPGFYEPRLICSDCAQDRPRELLTPPDTSGMIAA